MIVGWILIAGYLICLFLCLWYWTTHRKSTTTLTVDNGSGFYDGCLITITDASGTDEIVKIVSIIDDHTFIIERV